MTRILSAAAAAVVLAASVLVPVVSAPTAHAADVPTEVEASDFASEQYRNAWDYSDTADQNTDQASAQSIAVSGGQLRMTIGPGAYFSPVDAIPGSFPSARDGQRTPVPSNRYTRLSFSMNETLSGRLGAVYWWTCAAKTVSCMGGTTFSVRPGTQTYDIDLAASSVLGAKTPWSSAPIVSFRVQPVIFADGSAERTSVSIDWLRLHAAPTAAQPHAAMPPGDYGSYRVEALPQPVVDSPNPDEGQDVTEAQGRAPWAFTSSANFAATGATVNNATIRGFGADGMTATNAGPDQNDPIVNLPISSFDGTKYHNLSFDLHYDGPFSLTDSPGGGKLARLIWTVPGTALPQVGNDIPTYSGANAATQRYDLREPAGLDDLAYQPRLGWGGQRIDSLRFDPNEDPGTNTWHLSNLHVRADPAAVGSTTVRFHDAAWVAGTTADVRVSAGGASTQIATRVPVAQGTNAVPFTLGSLAPGSYRVEVRMYHPSGAGSLSFASVPVSMTGPSNAAPKGSFDSASGSSSGATVRGWAFDPDASGATEVRLYDQTSGAPRPVGSVMTSLARPDVQRAVPGAPANTGWSTTVALPTGNRTVCAYAINQPAGDNPLLGCVAVTVSNTAPRGSLDAVAATASGFVVRGWAFDPDTTAPLSVAVYDQTSTPKFLGNGTTDQSRPDVQRAVPGAGPTTGFSVAVPSTSTGRRVVCVYAINVPAGDNPLLGCSAVDR